MSTAQSQARLASALWEAERHRATLAEALAEWSCLREPNMQALETDPALRRLSTRSSTAS